MTKPGINNSPEFDNMSPADMGARAPEEQVRIGDETLIPTPEPKPQPGLDLTEKEQAKMDTLMKTGGLDKGTAALYSVSASKAKRIIGHHHASVLKERYASGEGEKSREGQQSGISDEEFTEIIRSAQPNQQKLPKPDE